MTDERHDEVAIDDADGVVIRHVPPGSDDVGEYLLHGNGSVVGPIPDGGVGEDEAAAQE